MAKKRKSKIHHDWHHRKPRSKGGKTDDRNMVHVTVSKHRAWHLLFKNYEAHQIVFIINTVWLDPDFEVVLKEKGA